MKIGYCSLSGRSGHEAAWTLLETMYREETGLPLPPVLRTDRGKPYFSDSPWHFSLSHTSRHAFCVLAKENVGLDAEELERQVNPRLAQRLLSDGEKAQYDRAEDKNRALLTFWVQKEAFAKLSGNGLADVMRKSEFFLSDPHVRELAGCLVAVKTDGPIPDPTIIKETFYVV